MKHETKRTNSIVLRKLLSNLYGAFGLEGIAWIEGIDSTASNVEKYANRLGANFPRNVLRDLKRDAYIRCYEINKSRIETFLEFYPGLPDERKSLTLVSMEENYREANECAKRLGDDSYKFALNSLRQILERKRERLIDND